MQNYKLDIDAIPGERWFPKETSFTEDLNEYWGDWGVCSEVDTLKAVLMRRPGKEVEKFDAQAVRFSDEPIDVELLRNQHDAVAKIYTDFGAKVMTYECGMRFLTDYLQGDTYFKIHREEHNLDRCRTQFKLVSDMEKKWGQMHEIVKKYM